jgi:hypothetical protein
MNELVVDRDSLIKCFELLKKCEQFLDEEFGTCECGIGYGASELSFEIYDFLKEVGFQ